MKLRTQLQTLQPTAILDFYEAPLHAKWIGDHTVKTIDGEEKKVTVPEDGETEDQQPASENEALPPEVKKSIQIQSSLARIGAIMGFKIWIPTADRKRVKEQLDATAAAMLMDKLPLNYDLTTLATIELIDVLWVKGQSIVRAFEVEHTTAVYSGLLRMADLLALQPNMNIRLHIVAAEERREKVFREMRRPVFTLLARGPLSDCCTFISYDAVSELGTLTHLAYLSDSVIAEYEERE